MNAISFLFDFQENLPFKAILSLYWLEKFFTLRAPSDYKWKKNAESNYWNIFANSNAIGFVMFRKLVHMDEKIYVWKKNKALLTRFF